MTLGSYLISPDESKLAIMSSRSKGQDRQVDYIVYRDRFAQVRKTGRGVADDNFNTESYVFLYDLNDDPKVNPKHDGKPWEIWKWAGGEEWWETSLHENPWSPDSSKFVFGTWKRDKKELEIVEADLAARKTNVIYKGRSEGEHRTPSLAQPFYTPDGKNVVLLLDTSGWRHAHIIDPLIAGARQLTQGEFEVYPLECSPDGRWLYARSTKENLANMDIYKIDMTTGAMHRLTRQAGQYSQPEFTKDGSKFAVTHISWDSLRELYVSDGKAETRLTSSHREKDFWSVIKLKPQQFNYTNRHGQTVHGFLFLPPGHKKEEPRPLMVYVYGGPLGTGKSVTNGNFASSDYMFNMLLAHELGFITVTIDPRGQSGYSAAFGKANREAPGVAQTEDLVDGVKYLAENYGVDTSKVAINGWSFGGFQTIQCMLTAPETFTLGIAGAGPTEWQNYNTWYTGGVIGDSRAGKPEDLDKYSLTHLAGNLRNPLMLLHGIEDTNVLYQDTINLYRRLLQAGKGPLVEFVPDPTGGHGLGGDIDTRDRLKIYLSFIKRRWGLSD